jgi:hypothetical protein
MTPGTTEAFLELWSQWYFDPREDLYESNIGRELTPERIRLLFEWKNGGPLSEAKRTSVERNYIDHLNDVVSFGDSTGPEDFLRRFPQGGAIWRIFWLHCWKPERFPIYDQHVYRSMMYIIEGRCDEMPKWDEGIVESYITKHLPFYREQLPELPNRQVDKALWFFGKFLKGFPCRQRAEEPCT